MSDTLNFATILLQQLKAYGYDESDIVIVTSLYVTAEYKRWKEFKPLIDRELTIPDPSEYWELDTSRFIPVCDIDFNLYLKDGSILSYSSMVADEYCEYLNTNNFDFHPSLSVIMSNDSEDLGLLNCCTKVIVDECMDD